jgi:hypothetical protein
MAAPSRFLVGNAFVCAQGPSCHFLSRVHSVLSQLPFIYCVFISRISLVSFSSWISRFFHLQVFVTPSYLPATPGLPCLLLVTPHVIFCAVPAVKSLQQPRFTCRTGEHHLCRLSPSICFHLLSRLSPVALCLVTSYTSMRAFWLGSRANQPRVLWGYPENFSSGGVDRVL